ncbi:MDC1 protein, partial [Rhinoptilus africanus]|nr:MDC1 protein [Rhinoptilus africanus]
SLCPQVLFTGVVASPDMEVALRTLGGSMATSVFDCTHLVTDRVRRTVKFLCAVARGVPIVTPEWLHKVPWGRGTGEGDLGERERVFGDRKEDLGGHGGPWGQGTGVLGTRRGSLGTRDLLGTR